MAIKKIIFFVLIALLIIAQFFVSEENSSDYASLKAFEKEVSMPLLLSKDLQSQCYDCHSNHTAYPWYNKIGVVSLFLNRHINEGKEHLNFSEWQTYSPKEKDLHLHEVYEEVSKNHMPLKLYQWTHAPKHSASKQTRQRILEWSETFK